MGTAKLDLLVTAGKKLEAAQLSVLKRVLDGKTFQLGVTDGQMKPSGEVADRFAMADEILELLYQKAPDLKRALKVIVKTAQFKTVPDDCAVTMEIDTGTDTSQWRSAVKLAPPRTSDPTQRTGYKPATLTLSRSIAGADVYGGVDLAGVLVLQNPSIEVSLVLIGPAAAAVMQKKLGEEIDGVLQQLGVVQIGPLVKTSADKLAKLGEAAGKDPKADAGALKKELDGLNRAVAREISLLQKAALKAANDFAAMPAWRGSGFSETKFGCTVLARMTKFSLSPDLEILTKSDKASLNDRQVRPLSRELKDLMKALKGDGEAHKKCAKALKPAFEAMAEGGKVDPAMLRAAVAGCEAFRKHLDGVMDGLRGTLQVIGRVGKNAKREKPDSKSSKEEKKEKLIIISV